VDTAAQQSDDQADVILLNPEEPTGVQVAGELAVFAEFRRRQTGNDSWPFERPLLVERAARERNIYGELYADLHRKLG
jgi:hypothetical protein